MKHHLLKFLTLLLALAATTTGLAHAQLQQPPPPDTVVYQINRMDSVLYYSIRWNQVNFDLRKDLGYSNQFFKPTIFSDSVMQSYLRKHCTKPALLDSMLQTHYVVLIGAELSNGDVECSIKNIPNQNKTIFNTKTIEVVGNNGQPLFFTSSAFTMRAFIPKQLILQNIDYYHEKTYTPFR
jgi:hypothetical protein